MYQITARCFDPKEKNGADRLPFFYFGSIIFRYGETVNTE